MKVYLTLGALALVAGCAKNSDQAQSADSTAARPAPVNMSAMAGHWHVKATNEKGDSLVAYDMVATADTAGWTITFPGRPALPLHVAPVGGMMRFSVGPYASVLRAGVQVTTEGTLRMVGDSLVGSSIAHYTVAGPDSVLHIKVVGHRVTQ